MFLTLFAEDFLSWCFICIFGCFLSFLVFFGKETGIANAFYSSVYTEFVILQYWWKPQSKMLILLFLLLFLFFFFFDTQCNQQVFFFLLFQFLMPVYNVKLFLQHVTVIIFKYFFSSLKITKQNSRRGDLYFCTFCTLTFLFFCQQYFMMVIIIMMMMVMIDVYLYTNKYIFK